MKFLILALFLGSNLCFAADNKVTPKPAKPAASSPKIAGELALTKEDDVDIVKTPGGQESKGRLFKGVVVKIKETAKAGDVTWYSIESEYGNGWIPSSVVELTFDRSAAKEVYDTALDMSWFYDRFNEGTYYESRNFTKESFSAEEIRTLINAVGDTGEQGVIARKILSDTLLPQVASGSKSPEALYFGKILKSQEFWLGAHSTSREFWASMPKDLLADSDFLLKVVPQGAYLAYDLFAAKPRDHKEIAIAAFRKSPEMFKFASERLRDDRDVAFAAAMLNPLVMEHASKRLRDDESLFKQIAPVNAMTVQFASDRLKNDPDFMAEVCHFRPWSIQYASKKVLDTDGVFLKLAAVNPMVVRLASERIQNDPAVLKKIYEASAQGFKEDFYHWLPAKARHLIVRP